VEAWALVQRAERLRKQADSLFRADDVASALRSLGRADSTLAAAEAKDPRWMEPVLQRGGVSHQRSAWRLGSKPLPGSTAGSPTPLGPQAGAQGAQGARAARRAPVREVAPAGCRGSVAQRRLLQDARSDLETATQADPTLATANLTLSHLLYQVDDVPGAMLRARQAYEEDAYLSSADWAVDRLFWGALDLEQFSEARRWCATGVQRFPNDPRLCHASCGSW